MKVILLQELKGKGGEGDIVEVAPGFANNYLLPNKIAILATEGNIKQLEMRRHNIAKREETRLSDAALKQTTLEGDVLNIEARVGEEGQLFGSVTSQMIADALKEQFQVDVDKRRIDLKNPIKTAGEHEVTVSIYRDIKSTIKVKVGNAEALAAMEAAEAEAEADAAAPETDVVEADAAAPEAAETDAAAPEAAEAAEAVAETASSPEADMQETAE